MSDEKDNGGPAFPLNASDAWGGPQEGMTLRDYIAVQVAGHLIVQIDAAINASEIARQAFVVADAMIAARKGGVA